ncbi:helix-turn-helix transcriptional regulator [Microbacterium mitrae]|uniref:Helix-turn-helix transcriptional regulator n=1 Tax=Microbacterium mitrae TaxID=664640 RepID=A0A5C8HKZ4_9MICO|nr:helix-turn-helix transcriptional regulator [Microbacterium mitrae]
MIGQRIAALRKARALTQDQLAVFSGIDSSNIRSYESGRSMLSVFTLVRIAEALDSAPGDFLVDLTSDMFSAPVLTVDRALLEKSYKPSGATA